MLTEVARERGAEDAAPRRERALYPKLHPGPHSVAPESVASNQRARLYGAMIELVAARGYEASTVAELCALAGVSKRTLYERFPDGKQQCFLATYDIIVRRAEMHILAGVRCAFGVGPLERLRGVVEAFAREVAAYPNAARLVVVEAAGAGPEVRAHTERTRRLVERVICWSLCAGHDAPALSPLTVKRFVADGTWLVRARLRDGRTSELTRELSDLCVVTMPSEIPPEMETVSCA
ncbi:MAG: TetR/AcrR family transcriptional regulator [Thermoanaerobaculales bacterium]